jgi:hypothetical protein
MRRILTTIIGFGHDLRFYNSTKIKKRPSQISLRRPLLKIIQVF